MTAGPLTRLTLHRKDFPDALTYEGRPTAAYWFTEAGRLFAVEVEGDRIYGREWSILDVTAHEVVSEGHATLTALRRDGLTDVAAHLASLNDEQ